MSDFSRKDTLHLAPSLPTFPEPLKSLHNLRHFGRSFYNADTVDVLDAAVQFIEEFGEESEPDNNPTSQFVLWGNMKFSSLATLLYDQQQANIARLMAQLDARPSLANTGHAGGREQKTEKCRGIPESIQYILPKQDTISLYLKNISIEGCSGSGTAGKYLSPKRAHFQTKTLPVKVKTYIVKYMGGIALEYANR
ncbi:hypothetical protein PHMEG_0006109 [Phytophthora megakarya]|uniref:Uncharacterized protein n=1 Tax=Phytophthora megakarya TaxID=4795 RepID=A0A225WPY2_9STRA|nr:hypothetical protein PHMEG_0006109 [Phytophthora megakarya]